MFYTIKILIKIKITIYTWTIDFYSGHSREVDEILN